MSALTLIALWLTAAAPTMTAVFDLNNQQAGVLKVGSSHVTAVSAWASHVAHERPYGGDALELSFFTVPLTRADTADIVSNDARQLHKHDFAFVVLFLDKTGKISQVNMTFVVPGTTVTRTVAYTSAQLADWGAKFSFDGKQVKLKTTGKLTELDDKKAPLTLAWAIDIDLPVVEHAGK
ncbi:MAG: hypothetical protein ACREN6_07255 [Gemmatimonadaceae bacterium]